MKLLVNWPAMALIVGMGGGMVLNECRSQQTFREQKESVEKELERKLPDILPEGWRAISTPNCVTWCRTMFGSEFDVEVMTNEPAFTKLRISCDTEQDEHSCGYRHLVQPCEDRHDAPVPH